MTKSLTTNQPGTSIYLKPGKKAAGRRALFISALLVMVITISMTALAVHGVFNGYAGEEYAAWCALYVAVPGVFIGLGGGSLFE